MSRASRLASRLALGLVPVLALTAAPAPAVAADPAPARPAALPCGDQSVGRTRCSRVLVPLDRSGAVEGRIGLSVRTIQLGQKRRKVRREAVLFLAGGPGQAATSLAADVAGLTRPFLKRRDLVAVDTRGSGRSSDLIVCPELETGALNGLSVPESFRSCARRIPAVDAYGTTDVVQDLEAVRVAGGYDRLFLVGVSYGTFTAQRYAAAHPDRVSGLVLDSTVDAAAGDPFTLDTFRALPRAVANACLRRACRGVTRDVAADLERTRARLPITADVDDGTGRRRPATVTASTVISLIQAGDVDPFTRATLPAALRRAGEGDAAPLARLSREAGLLPLPTDDEDPAAGPAAAASVTVGGYVATTCRDTRLPWAPGTPTGEPRRAAAIAALAATSPRSRGGWSPEQLVDITTAGICQEWPGTPDPAPAPGPLPRVPTLLLSGADDTRTSPEEARRVAARLPGSTLLPVPGAGHSLIGSGRGCVTAAFKSFAAGKRVRPCHLPSKVQPAVALVPSSPAGLGRTAADRARGVAHATIVDAIRSVVLKGSTEELDLFSEPKAIRVAGLRSGTATLSPGGRLRLERMGYVPGTAVSTGPIEEQRLLSVVVRGRGVRAGRYTIPNPLNDPDVVDELGIDPDLTADLTESFRRLRRAAPAR